MAYAHKVQVYTDPDAPTPRPTNTCTQSVLTDIYPPLSRGRGIAYHLLGAAVGSGGEALTVRSCADPRKLGRGAPVNRAYTLMLYRLLFHSFKEVHKCRSRLNFQLPT